MARLILCDDEAALTAMLEEHFVSRGHEVRIAPDGAALRRLTADAAPDLVVLDLGLPGEDGLSLARWLRSTRDIGIVMLTGADDVIDRVVGLEVGADDYVTKPFSLSELSARVEAVLRRRRSLGEVVRFGGCLVDLKRWTIFDAAGKSVDLGPSEIDLVVAFATNAGKALSRDDLIRLAPARASEPLDRSIDNRITRLRRKLARHGVPDDAIETVRGGGYICRRGDA